ncbi:homeobox domain-containing protein [Gilbertella persicaria]|uniref:homeobox domain-containing protein n=1 Tax=Gilbertella persicaria TaxID=101096 RepID=UPI00221EFD68|nr:homeobox domain-containing protein [Gilbertella persicaria]KAI8064820.1 homeobox domain-containing protein [Gilbertella persicaria]
MSNHQRRNKRLQIKSHEANNKPKRKRITPYQLSILSDLFKSTDTPNYELRENIAERLSMTNREVQIWFQNRRAKVNRSRIQEQKKLDPFIYPSHWTTTEQPQQYYSYPSQTSHDEIALPSPIYNDYSGNDSQSSITSSSDISTPTMAQYPHLSPHMNSIEILALAAEYVQRCDEEKRLTDERRKYLTH